MTLILLSLPLTVLLILGICSHYCGRTARYSIIIPLSLTLCEVLNILLRLADHSTVIILGNLISLDYFEILWEFTFNSFTLAGAGLVIFLSLMIQAYSLDYMGTDLNLVFFFSLLTLFTFSMSIFIYAASFALLLIGWEGIGILSYLLINFWSLRIEACKSSLKAIFINKLGDTALILSLLFLFNVFLTTNLQLTNNLALYIRFETVAGAPLTAIVAILLVTAGITKSAQLFLSVWLPDAMEGPTPVSSLLHSATMVVAGLLLLIKFSTLLSQTPYILTLLLTVGFVTALMASCESLCTGDIKSALASSTCEQIGLMFIIYGLGYLNLAFFHFYAHAFYKSLAFLSVGLIIHAIGESEGEFVSGWDEDSLFAGTAPVSAAAVMGLPGTVGHYSKSIIFSVLYSQGITYSGLFYMLNQLLQFNNNACSALAVIGIAGVGIEFSERKREYQAVESAPLAEGVTTCTTLYLLVCLVLWGGPALSKLYAFQIFPGSLTSTSWDISWLYYKSLPTWIIYGTFLVLAGSTQLLFLYRPTTNHGAYLQPSRADQFSYDQWFNLASLWFIRLAYDLGFYLINNCLTNFSYYLSRLLFANYHLAALYTDLHTGWLSSYQIVITLAALLWLTG